MLSASIMSRAYFHPPYQVRHYVLADMEVEGRSEDVPITLGLIGGLRGVRVRKFTEGNGNDLIATWEKTASENGIPHAMMDECIARGMGQTAHSDRLKLGQHYWNAFKIATEIGVGTYTDSSDWIWSITVMVYRPDDVEPTQRSQNTELLVTGLSHCECPGLEPLLKDLMDSFLIEKDEEE